MSGDKVNNSTLAGLGVGVASAGGAYGFWKLEKFLESSAKNLLKDATRDTENVGIISENIGWYKYQEFHNIKRDATNEQYFIDQAANEVQNAVSKAKTAGMKETLAIISKYTARGLAVVGVLSLLFAAWNYSKD